MEVILKKTMGKKFMEIMRKPITKILASVVCTILVFLFGSWTANQTLKQNLDGYKNYTISQVIGNELNKKDGVNQQLTEIKAMLVIMQEKQDKKDDADYQNWIADINKYYNWSDGKHDSMLSSGYLDKMSIYWGALPDKYKTDIVKAHYDYAFDYIRKVCK